MLDENNYPDEKSLEEIKTWDLLSHGVDDFLDLIEDNTYWADRQTERSGKNVIHYVYHTGGWSGNEDVIQAMRQNYLFWAISWEKSTRGGHYYFKIKRSNYANLR